jgi:hypothetical protein
MDLREIERLERTLLSRFADRMRVNPTLGCTLVSFQANKAEPVYRWFKFKEGFSAALVRYFLDHEGSQGRRLLDPFAGSGTALFAAGAPGMDADGIELLPIGVYLIRARMAFLRSNGKGIAALERWLRDRPWRKGGAKVALRTLPIH